jgi:hypothetical protein
MLSRPAPTTLSTLPGPAAADPVTGAAAAAPGVAAGAAATAATAASFVATDGSVHAVAMSAGRPVLLCAGAAGAKYMVSCLDGVRAILIARLAMREAGGGVFQGTLMRNPQSSFDRVTVMASVCS